MTEPITFTLQIFNSHSVRTIMRTASPHETIQEMLQKLSSEGLVFGESIQACIVLFGTVPVSFDETIHHFFMFTPEAGRTLTVLIVPTVNVPDRRLQERAIELLRELAEPARDFTTILIRNQTLSKDQLNDAIRLAQSTGTNVQEALIKLQYASPAQVMRTIAEFHNLLLVDLRNIDIPKAVIELLPESVARENVVLPYSLEGSVLKIIISDPTRFDTIQKLTFILNKDIHLVLADEEQIREAINRHYGETETESIDSMIVEFTDTAIDFTKTKGRPKEEFETDFDVPALDDDSDPNEGVDAEDLDSAEFELGLDAEDVSSDGQPPLRATSNQPCHLDEYHSVARKSRQQRCGDSNHSSSDSTSQSVCQCSKIRG